MMTHTIFQNVVRVCIVLFAHNLLPDTPAGDRPESPRVLVNTSEFPSPQRTTRVRSGENLQAALDAAQLGDTIALEAGATFAGPFVLRNKQGSGWITIRTSTPDGGFVPQATRVTPAAAEQMPKLEAASEAVIQMAPGANHYRFIGIEVRPRAGAFLHQLVHIGANATTLDALPHHIVFERCYLHGDSKQGTRRGIAMNGRHIAVIDSYLSDFKEAGADSQAIAAWNGPGPFKIVNNYLEAAGENIMFGGEDPSISNLVPSDIEIRLNHIAKPLAWKAGHPDYTGTRWTVKNLLELKNARRILIEGNLLEKNWPQAQVGFAVLFTVSNQGGAAPWSVVEDVSFVNNVVRKTASGINILARDQNSPGGSGQAKRILIKGNLFEDIGEPQWKTGGLLFQLLEGTAGLVIEHNTAFQTGNIITAEGVPHPNFVFRNNICPHNLYGIIGTDLGPGHGTLDRYFPGGLVENNVIVGGNPKLYPLKNFFPENLDQVGFVNRGEGNYRLLPSSRYKNAGTGGKDPGVDFETLSSAMPPALQNILRGRF